MLKLLNSEKIIKMASQRYESLSESHQKDLKESLCNGRALLRNEDQMAAYLHHYGATHKQKLLKAFDHYLLHC